MIEFNDAELAAMQDGTPQIGVFFRLATDPVVALWLGAGRIEPGVNVLDATGIRYLGCGQIQDIPVYKQLLNGAAERASFTMSGVSGAVFDAAAGESDVVIGKRIDVGIAFFARNWSLLGAVHWIANYRAGPISIRQQRAVDPSSPVLRTISLSAGSIFTARRRPNYSYWTDADQRARNPADAFCSLAAGYTHQFSIAWPIYT